jgi:hypothetical protein
VNATERDKLSKTGRAKTDRARQAEQGRQSKTGRARQAEQNRQSKTGRARSGNRHGNTHKCQYIPINVVLFVHKKAPA